MQPTTFPNARVALKARQTAFLDECLKTQQPLAEMLETMEITPETLADWLASRAFRRRVGGLVKQLRRLRELQVQIAARGAASMLAEISAGTAPTATRVMRGACADLVRLARGRPAKTGDATNASTGPTTARFHPDLAPEEAHALARELSRSTTDPAEAQG